MFGKSQAKTIALTVSGSLLAIGLTSCAGSYRRPESFEAKMARFQPRNTNPNKVPKIEIAPSLPQTFSRSAGRGPASQTTSFKKLPSNKRLYFITLYGQYRHLSSFVHTEQAPDIKHCPSFHTSLVNYKEGLPPIQNKELSVEKRYSALTPDQLASYPELSLPMSLTEETPRLYEVLKDKKGKTSTFYVTQALKVHLTKTYKELEELCESGSSDNYYNYENLTTHIQRQGSDFGPTKKSLQSLLKTTVFSNMTLIKSLENSVKRGRMPASSSSPLGHNYYQEGMIKKLGVEWTEGYFQSLKN